MRRPSTSSAMLLQQPIFRFGGGAAWISHGRDIGQEIGAGAPELLPSASETGLRYSVSADRRARSVGPQSRLQPRCPAGCDWNAEPAISTIVSGCERPSAESMAGSVVWRRVISEE